MQPRPGSSLCFQWFGLHLHCSKGLGNQAFLSGLCGTAVLDHLGTPLLITNPQGGSEALHSYFPFGEELFPDRDTERMKFTGHERDLNRAGQVDDLDYMHARYCSPLLGRFLSPDPLGAEPNRPQGWNRYAYALNNPLKWVDPTGETVSLADLEEGEQELLLERLNEFTGNTYGVNDSLQLVLLEVGASSSGTATSFLNDAIGDERVFTVESTTGKNEGRPGEPVRINFATFSDTKYGKVDPATFSLGSTFVHELYHSSTGIEDFDGYPGGIINQSDFSWRGPVVDFVNQIRAERGLPQRAGYLTQPGLAGRSKFPFDHVNPRKPEKIHYVRRSRPWD